MRTIHGSEHKHHMLIPILITIALLGASIPASAQLSGTYTIGSGGNYASFTAAISALSTNGVSGPVTFNVFSGTYTEQITIPAISGASATNTITFDGIDASTRTLQYSVSSSYGRVVTLNGADYIRIKNLTISSTNSTYGFGILFTNAADYNEITDCVINLPSTSTSIWHMGILASSASSYSSTGNWGSNNLIQGNRINGGYYGIRFNGASGSSYTQGAGNKFIDNEIIGYYYYGLYLRYQSHPEVIGNTIIPRLSSTNPITAYNSSSYGMYIYYGKNGPEIVGNTVMAGRYPFYFYYSNLYTQSTANRALVANNMFVQIGTSTAYGLRIYYPRYTDVVFNSVHIRTNSTAYGMYLYGYTSNYNNKVLNNWVSYRGSGTFYAQYNNSAASFSEFDHNGYYAFNANVTPRFHWGSTSSYYTSLTAMQNAVSGFHQNSVWGNPYWVDETDLHSRSHVGYQAGTAFAAVTDDIDGDTRGINPSIGADEYPVPPPEYDLSIAKVMINTADGKWAHREDPSEHDVMVVLANTGLSNDPASVTVVYKEGSEPIDATDGVQQTFSPLWSDHKATLTFTQKLTGLTAGTMPAVYAKVFWAADEDNSNDVAMDDPYIETEKVHGVETFEKMSEQTYPLTRYAGYLDLPWTIIDNNGGETLEIWSGDFNGSSQALAMGALSEEADEWVVTPAADLVAGSSYRLDFEFRNWGGAPVTIEAAWGDTPDPSQMTVFATFANIGVGGFLSAKQLAGGLDPYFNTPLYNGTFFVALRFTTSGTGAYFSIDNIKIDDNPSPPPKTAFGLPGTELSTFIDNPASRITMLANYKQPGVIHRTYEVQSKTNIYGVMGDFLWDVETTTPWISLTKETPNPTLQGYNLTPPRPRQFQTFTMSVNPSGLAPGTHMGMITFYGILFNNDFPPPANGLVATNEPLNIEVELIITNAGSKSGPSSISQTIPTPLTVPGSPYDFADPLTGDPIATVEVTSGQIDAMTITAYPNQLPQNLQRKLFVKRYWQITHTGSGWTANITFPYADIEASMISDKLQLRGVRQPVTLGAWEDPIMGTSSVSDALTNTVKVHDFNEWNIGGNIALSQPYMVAAKGGAAPSVFGLEQNYPNPFNPSTAIVFTVAEERGVRLVVYDALGAEVAELVNEVLPAGRYEVTFDASSLPSGTYIYRMQAGDFTATQRMTLSK
jgi:hypothetical protein